MTCELPPNQKHPQGLTAIRVVTLKDGERGDHYSVWTGRYVGSTNFGYLQSIEGKKQKGRWVSCAYDAETGEAAVVLELREVAGVVETDEYMKAIRAASNAFESYREEINRDMFRQMERLYVNHQCMSVCASKLSQRPASDLQSGPCALTTSSAFRAGNFPVENYIQTLVALYNRNAHCEQSIGVCEKLIAK